MPPTINFDYVWANADFMRNPTIYATVIVCVCLFILLAVFARIMDIRDNNRLGLNLLPDNEPNNSYCYEIIVFTGNRYYEFKHAYKANKNLSTYFILFFLIDKNRQLILKLDLFYQVSIMILV